MAFIACKMFSVGFLSSLLLLLLSKQIQAATHVNISIAQHELSSASPAISKSNSEYQSARLIGYDDSVATNARATPAAGHAYQQQYQQQQANSQQFSQLRKAQAQKQQNQEFERYIQSYHHSGPTVETVFETSSPAPARYQKASSFSQSESNAAQPQMAMHKFERQVALPNVASSRQEYAQTSQADVKPVTEASQENVNGLSHAAEKATSTTNVNDYEQQANYDFNNNYNLNHNYDNGKFNYDEQSDFHHQIPPVLDYDSSGSGESAHAGYLPPASSTYPRPVVTKTIQIAQPALKAKKYEVRHPAIQKEFYDIEERVLIKPAGTIVVELERPVAKIPRGEAILPLGIPHPAVAGAYNNNGLSVSQTQSNTVNQQQQYLGKNTVGSTVTTTPGYDQNLQMEVVNSNLRKTYNNAGDSNNKEENSADSAQTNKNYFVVVDGQGQQRQMSTKNITPKMFVPQARDDVDAAYRKKSNEANLYHGYSGQLRHDDVAKQYRDDYFAPEYVDPSQRQAQDSKPARLQLAPKQAADDLQQKPMVTQHIIKHEHNIHIPPSQHNIYLGRMHNSRYEDEAARVLEIKPFAQRQKPAMLVYASANKQRAQLRQPESDAQHLQYSAPYAQMRYVPQESAKLREEPKSSNVAQMRYVPQESAKLREEPKHNAEHAHAHIHIQIPQQTDKENGAIMIQSTISPMSKTAQAFESNNNDVETFGQLKADKPDCDQSTNNKQHFSRLTEVTANGKSSASAASMPSAENATPSQVETNVAELGSERRASADSNVQLNIKSNSGHVNNVGSRVIAATPAPTDAASSSESFHKRRIVVNHPFQTVREVVEHEPITNYHHVQVNEPALAPYYQMNDALRQLDDGHLPAIVYPTNVQTHGHLHYGYHQHI